MNIQPTAEEAQIYPYLDQNDQGLFQQKMIWDRKPKPAIDYLMFAITYKCNARCKMCRIWEHPPVEEMTIEEYEKLCQDPLVKNVGRADFTGGEPFIRKDFLNIVKTVVETIPIRSITIPTNGWYTDRVKGFYKKMRTFYDGWLHIGLSIDGFEPAHDEIRGKGFWKRAMATLSFLDRQRRDDPALGTGIKATIIGDDNVGDVDAMLRHFKSAEVKYSLAINCENNENMDTEFQLSDTGREIYENLLEKYPWEFGPFTEFVNIKMKNDPPSVNLPCIECLDKSLYVKPEGDIFGCVYSRGEHLLGNIREYDSLTDLVNRNYKRVIEARDTCSGCIADCYYNNNVMLTAPYYEWKARRKAIGW